MQNTTNLNLKKPEYTDFADIQDINDNMDTLDEVIHDTQNSVATFTSSDVADGSAASWTTVPKVASGETHKSIFAKMSQMFKNIRFLYKMLGTTDISSIGNGTVTGGLSSLNSSLTGLVKFGVQDFSSVSWMQDAAVGGYRAMLTLNVPEDPNQIIIPVSAANTSNAGQICVAAWQGNNIIRIVMPTNSIAAITIRYVRITGLS